MKWTLDRDVIIGNNRDVIVVVNRDVIVWNNRDVMVGVNRDVMVGNNREVIVGNNRDVIVGLRLLVDEMDFGSFSLDGFVSLSFPFVGGLSLKSKN
jgi:hypothetical protein